MLRLLKGQLSLYSKVSVEVVRMMSPVVSAGVRTRQPAAPHLLRRVLLLIDLRPQLDLHAAVVQVCQLVEA